MDLNAIPRLAIRSMQFLTTLGEGRRVPSCQSSRSVDRPRGSQYSVSRKHFTLPMHTTRAGMTVCGLGRQQREMRAKGWVLTLMMLHTKSSIVHTLFGMIECGRYISMDRSPFDCQIKYRFFWINASFVQGSRECMSIGPVRALLSLAPDMRSRGRHVNAT